ncbi:glycosyltransferase family 1 protein [Kyrpidia spormannii]|uniref:Glycosyltransferase family 1 protein n=1 Tax=Kyrpidia spormannii TaxID=2055160 RepID=A0A2K8NB68_9BACL|nr:glycosyltransferase family 4 protein [Kyrpidia spormannii]ATY86365.1 glycosyltransferase family 1 protein [Kyrpidia spormannii]
MKLFYLITRSEQGGAQTHVLDLIRGFRGRADIVLGVGEEGYLAEQVRDSGIDVHVLPHLVQPVSPAKDWLALWEINSLIRKFQPDLVHAHSSKAGFLGRLAAYRAGVPAVFTAHGWAFADGVPWGRKIVATVSERRAGRWCERIITVSEADRILALRHRIADENTLVTIRNGIADTPRRAEPTNTDEPRIVMVARFARPKDQSLLIRALEGLNGEFSLSFVGDGPTRREMEALTANSSICHRITFLGARADVAELLAKAHVFVLTSNWEGFPISILEAMRAGLPVVASDVGGVCEAVVDGETGYLVPRGDEVTLRDRLKRLITNPDLRTRMGQAGRRRYEQHFTLDKMLNRTWQVYEEVLREHRR